MNWQYRTLPYVLQFIVALLGLFVAAYAYDRRKRPATLVVAGIFAVGFLLPFFSNVILKYMPMRVGWLADTLIPNNRYGLLFYLILTVVPWLYFWPQAYVWLTTPPDKRRRRK